MIVITTIVGVATVVTLGAGLWAAAPEFFEDRAQRRVLLRFVGAGIAAGILTAVVYELYLHDQIDSTDGVPFSAWLAVALIEECAKSIAGVVSAMAAPPGDARLRHRRAMIGFGVVGLAFSVTETAYGSLVIGRTLGGNATMLVVIVWLVRPIIAGAGHAMLTGISGFGWQPQQSTGLRILGVGALTLAATLLHAIYNDFAARGFFTTAAYFVLVAVIWGSLFHRTRPPSLPMSVVSRPK